MKNKIKKSIKLLGVFLFLITISCQTDSIKESISEDHSHGKSPNEVSFDFFQKTTTITDVDSFLKEKMSTNQMQSRSSSYSLSNFLIDTTLINQCVLKDGGLSFSFRIYPTDNSESPNEVYNLVISKIDNQWETSIFLLTKNAAPIDEELFSSIEEVYQSAGLPSGIMARRIVEYRTRQFFHCPKLAPCTATWCDLCPERCRTTEIVAYIIHTPEENDDLSLQDPIFNYNGGGGGGSPTNSNNTTPCDELAKLSNSIPHKSALTDLKGQTNQVAEKGYAVKKNSTNNTYRSPETANAMDINIPNHIKVGNYLGGEYVGFFHTHPKASDGYIPMFPPEDINYLYFVALSHQTNGQPKNYSEYFLTLTVPQGTYAIKIKDMVKFAALRNSKWKGDEGLDKILKRKFDLRDPEGDIDLMIKDLLDVFKSHDAGIGLYVASEDLSTWSEIVHELNPMSPNFGKPKNVPCN